MRHTIWNQATSKPEYSNQLLLVIRSKDNIGKSQVIKAISQTNTIIGKINSIFITALSKTTTNNISRSTLYIVLGIDT